MSERMETIMELSLVSFNLRCVWDNGDGVNCFLHRSGMVLEKLRAEKPDVICFQEAMPPHIDFLRQFLPEYDFVFNQRDADFSGEGLAVAIKRNVVEIYQYSMFWLSDTPSVPGSCFEKQSGLPRIVQNMILRDLRTGKFFRVHNTHLDHAYEEARTNGIRVVLDHIAQCQKQWELPVFLLGDFNACPDSDVIRACETHPELEIVDTTEKIDTTFHEFGKRLRQENTKPFANKIDYIFTDSETSKHPYTVGVWKENCNGIYLSDHYPVFLKIEL